MHLHSVAVILTVWAVTARVNGEGADPPPAPPAPAEPAPTTAAPTTAAPAPTTAAPTTAAPAPTTAAPAPTTAAPAAPAAGASDYCSICPNKGHTMCKYTNASAVRSDGGVTDADQTVIVAALNKERQKVAEGKELRGRPGPQPAAANMRVLAWDKELATVAQRWADQCPSPPSSQNDRHDECRTDPRFSVGQNVFVGPKTAASSTTGWSDVIAFWVNKVVNFNAKNVAPYKGVFAKDYVNAVWADTNTVGCGYAVCKRPNKAVTLAYVCNFAPGGEKVMIAPDARMYQIGAGCSNCTAGCDATYTALCK